MEVTNLKELKKLMKGDGNKFEFEEDHEIGTYDNGMQFNSNGFNNKGSKGATYDHTYGNSHKNR